MSGWMGNYENRANARFIAESYSPQVVWPALAFQPDASGGYGVDSVTGDRHDVLARDNPSWAKAILAAAIEAKMPLRAKRIGHAGKYAFWLLCAASPAEAEAESLRLKAEADASSMAADVAELRKHYKLPEDYAIVTADGDVILAESVQSWREGFNRRGYSGGEHRMLVDGKIMPIPAGATLQQM